MKIEASYNLKIIYLNDNKFYVELFVKKISHKKILSIKQLLENIGFYDFTEIIYNKSLKSYSFYCKSNGEI
jgi:hypothetical protein